MLPKFAFFQGEIVPYSEAKVGVLTHGLNYGTGAFGGVRGYWNDEEEQIYIFRPHDHFKRLLNSGKLLLMNLPHTADGLTKITKALIQKEGYREDVYVRPLIYKADEMIGVVVLLVRDLGCGLDGDVYAVRRDVGEVAALVDQLAEDPGVTGRRLRQVADDLEAAEGILEVAARA